MANISTSMEPTKEDIYYFETMAELDEYEATGSDSTIVDAQVRSQSVLFLVAAVLLISLFIFRDSQWLQFLIILIVGGLWGAFSLFRLLDLCDD